MSVDLAIRHLEATLRPGRDPLQVVGLLYLARADVEAALERASAQAGLPPPRPAAPAGRTWLDRRWAGSACDG